MRVAILSDVHLDGPEDEVQRLFLRFIRALEADELWLLGDVFHRFWTIADQPLSVYDEVFRVLRDRIQGGLRIRWIPGNHDFALSDHWAYSVGLDVSEVSIEADIGGCRVHAEHGDLADSSWSYALTTLALRGPLFSFALRLAGPKRAWTWLGRLAGTAHHEGPTVPVSVVAAQRRCAAGLLDRAADLVVMGHTHVPVRDVRSAGAFVNLGAFDKERHILIVEDGRVSRCRVELSGELVSDPWVDPLSA
jgi:UDP-2,3-diacylglucosamine pyrophosphatase LpxH